MEGTLSVKEEGIHESFTVVPEPQKMLGLASGSDHVNGIWLISGETVVSKSLQAASIHYNGIRKNKMFIAQSCLRCNVPNLGIELFGYKKGAFAGAISDKKGLIEIADEGTLFLDNIEEMNMVDQARLLGFLTSGMQSRIGSNDQMKSNVRILAASNKNLQNQVENGDFLESLLYRINKLNITSPSSKEGSRNVKRIKD